MYSNECHWSLDDKIDIDFFFYFLEVICSFGINMRTEVHFCLHWEMKGHELRVKLVCENDARLQRRQPWATVRVKSNVTLSARHFPRNMTVCVHCIRPIYIFS